MRIDGKESVLRTVAGDPTSWLAGAPGTGTSPPLSAVDPLSRTLRPLWRVPDLLYIPERLLEYPGKNAKDSQCEDVFRSSLMCGRLRVGKSVKSRAKQSHLGTVS